MQTIYEQLNDLAIKLDYVEKSSSNCKALIIHEELKKITPITSGNNYTILNIRWLKLLLAMNNPSIAIEIRLKYIEIAEKLRGLIKDFADNIQGADRKTPYDEQIIKNNLNEQLNSLLIHRLLSVSEVALDKYRTALHSRQAEIKIPTITDIWSETLSDYKDKLYKESIHEFETILLVNRYTILSSTKESIQSQHVNQATLDQIDLELKFYADKLGLKLHSGPDFVSLKLPGTKLFIEQILELNSLTLNNLSDKLEQIRLDIGKCGLIDPSSSSETSYNKSIEDNFYNGQFGNISNHLKQAISIVEKIISDIVLPDNVAQITIESQDDKIINLRKLTGQYIEHLESIENKEGALYSNRKEAALITRRQALTTLKLCLERSSELTPSIRNITKSLISEIKAQQPQWSELSFLNKLLDILTLGIRPYLRYSTFKEPQPQADLATALTEESHNPK